MVALANSGCDGVLASADVMEDLALLGVLDGKLSFGPMKRCGSGYRLVALMLSATRCGR